MEKNQREKPEYQDDLTGLCNRRYFRERLLEEKRKADKKGSSFAVAMIDLDNFKPINDVHGHQTGDWVLCEVAKLLERSLRPSDVLSRYAGDEFVIILPEIGQDEITEVFEDIKENFTRAVWVDEKGKPIQPVTCSLGYAFYSEGGRDLNSLVGWADQALYAVKRRGGNGYCSEKDLPGEPTSKPLASTPRLVGREEELAELLAHLDRAQGGEGRLVLVHGEAGIGKTRLVRELKQIQERRGGTVVLGNCHEETRAIPYYPFREALRLLLEENAEGNAALLEGLPDYSQRELARIVPGLAELQPSELERAPDPFRLFEAVRLLFQGICARSKMPLLFIVENLHWSDDASLDLLHYLARNAGEAQILICGTYRTEETIGEEGSSFQRFVGSLLSEALLKEIALAPLNAKEVSRMLHLLLPGTEISQAFQDSLLRKTEGNPFFVEEYLRLADKGEITDDAPVNQAVPHSIDAVLKRRIDSLSPEMVDILACAALIGEMFEFEVLRRVTTKPQDRILDALEAGTRAQILRESFESGEEAYRFVHSLMADVLYSSVGKIRRRLWHGQVGEVLEEIYAGRLEHLSGRLVHHFERCGNWKKALVCALRSAIQAKEDYANQEAIRLYMKAREMLPKLGQEPPGEKIAIAEGLGDVYRITGDYEKALDEYKSAEAMAHEEGEREKEGDILAKIGRVCCLQGDYDKMIDYAKRSYRIYQELGHRQRVAESLDSIGDVHLNRGDYDQALKCYQDSLIIQKEVDDKSGEAVTLESLGNVYRTRGQYKEALKCYQKSSEIREGLGDRWGLASNLHNTGILHWSRGDYGEALKHYQDSLRIRREIGDKRGVSSGLHTVGIVHWGRGEYGKASQCFQESMKVQREIGDRWGTGLSSYGLGLIHWKRGDFEDALDCFHACLDIQRELGDKWGVALSLHGSGIVYWRQGDYRKALESFRECLRIREEIGDRWGMAFSLLEIGTLQQSLYDIDSSMKNHSRALALMEEIGMEADSMRARIKVGADYHLMGDNERALECLDKALDSVESLGIGEAEPSVLIALTEVWLSKGDTQKAMEFSTRLLEIVEREELKLYLANAKTIRAEILLAEGAGQSGTRASVKAESLLKDALSIAERIGAQPLIWKIHLLLGNIYRDRGEKDKSSACFAASREVIQSIASELDDENLKNAFLNSEQIQSALSQ